MNQPESERCAFFQIGNNAICRIAICPTLAKPSRAKLHVVSLVQWLIEALPHYRLRTGLLAIGNIDFVIIE
jgi:hypothetical protein